MKREGSLLLILYIGMVTACHKNTMQVSTVETNVYVAGSASNGTNVIAEYWKNGNPVALNTSGDFFATSIFVNDKDIYVAGYQLRANDQRTAVYWKNGNLMNLSDGIYDEFSTGITVIGNDIYVSGCQAGFFTTLDP